MRLLLWVAAVIVGASALAGCAETRAYQSYSEEIDSWTYGQKVAITFKDWALSGVDIFSAEVGMGETIGLNLQPTELLQIGALFGDTMKFGLRDRAVGFYREVREEGGFTWFYYRDMRFEPIMGTPNLFDRQRIFKGFPIRYNEEWHWMDLGGEFGLVFFEGSAHLSPKCALNFGIHTVLLPFNLLVRPVLTDNGVRVPEIDIMERDTESQIRKKYHFELIREPEMFEPTEVINDLVRVPG